MKLATLAMTIVLSAMPLAAHAGDMNNMQDMQHMNDMGSMKGMHDMMGGSQTESSKADS